MTHTDGDRLLLQRAWQHGPGQQQLRPANRNQSQISALDKGEFPSPISRLLVCRDSAAADREKGKGSGILTEAHLIERLSVQDPAALCRDRFGWLGHIGPCAEQLTSVPTWHRLRPPVVPDPVCPVPELRPRGLMASWRPASPRHCRVTSSTSSPIKTRSSFS
jgi:hypothetical protein